MHGVNVHVKYFHRVVFKKRFLWFKDLCAE